MLDKDKKYQEQIQKIKESNNIEVRKYLEKMEQKDKDFLEQEKKHQELIEDIKNKKDKKIEELLNEIEELKNENKKEK